MMATIQSYVRQGRVSLRRWVVDPNVRAGAGVAGYFLMGLVLSGASLGNRPQPFVMSLVLAISGWQAAVTGVGGTLGYLLFWHQAGIPGAVWTVMGLLVTLVLGNQKAVRQTSLLLPAVAGLIVAASGLGFQLWLGDATPIAMYLLRTALGAGAVRLFGMVLQRRSPVADWIAGGVGVLALAQVAPFPWFSLGFGAAGLIAAAGAFPAAAMAGLALDLAQVTPVPMTAVACLIYFSRLIPRASRWMVRLMPVVSYLLVMGLCGVWDMSPLAPLAAGGLLSFLYPGQTQVSHRRGETGVAQVRLEMVAGVLAQTEQLLLEAQEPPVDEQALVLRAVEQACAGCPCRKTCREREQAAAIPAQLLHRPLLDDKDLPVSCRKSGRILGELHRAQEQLRAIRGNRERQNEYRGALIQQYRFLSGYVRDLSDVLSRRGIRAKARFWPKVQVYANRKEGENGDRCSWFAGTENRYYVMLCDGMGRGMGAVEEGKNAAGMLKKLLTAGFPAEYALRSLNSLCALRGKAGAVTVDLAEICLDSGKTALYKWGAAPSYLVTSLGAEKIGTATPPPGLSVTDTQETVERLSLRRGEWLLMLSDGVGGEDALRCLMAAPGQPLGETAARILERASTEEGDDATLVAVCLSSAPVAT